MHRLVTLMSLVCLLMLWTIPAQAERRVALVIGNGAYKVTPLKNPVNDAQDIVAALKALGFEVTLLTDATHQQMDTAVREFGAKLQKGGVGLFFYAGHGVQVSGENYLVPIDSSMAVEADVKYGSLNAGKVLAQMEDAGNELNIVILDACRTNPFARSFRSAEQGLARMDAPKGSLIAYATAPGKVAADSGGGGRNSPYTSSLLRHMRTPGLKLEDTLKRVRVDVMRSTSEKQVPWDLSSLTGDFYFSQLLAQPLQAATASVSAPLQVEKKDKTLGDVFAGLFKKSEPLPATSPQQASVPSVPLATEQHQAQQAADAELLALQNDLVKQEEAAKDAKSKAERKKIEAEKALLRKRIEDARLAKERAEAEAKDAEAQALAKIQTQGPPKSADVNDQQADTPERWHKIGRLEFDNKNYAEAAIWFRKAAERGDAASQFFFGSMHNGLYGLKTDYKECVKWLRLSSNQGNMWAINGLGMMYEDGNGVKKNCNEAIKLYRIAAEQNNPLSQHNLGRLYENGICVSKNNVEAVRWFRKSAEQGYAHAQYVLGNILDDADNYGFTDHIEAARWYRLAADQGHEFAQEKLGNLYEEGRGIKQSYTSAFLYYSLAAMTRPSCSYLRNSITKKLTSTQLAEAQKLVAKWKANENKLIP